MTTRPARVLMVLVLLAVMPAAMGSVPKHFVHGLWFDGQTFSSKSFYVVDGVLRRRPPAGTPVETIDLRGGYVVPAFGDAHNHFPSSRENFSKSNRLFLESGVFYILNPNDVAERANPIRQDLGTAGTVDVVFAHAGFTCPGGHPTRLYEELVDEHIYPYAKAELEGRAFYSVASFKDIESKWPAFLATKPDFVKIYLLHSETYGQTSAHLGPKGLRPEFAVELIRRAHAAGLRVGAHIESAEDFHRAVAGGVDFVMHLPGYYWLPGDTQAEYLITDADTKLAGENRVTVVTTIDLADSTEKERLTREREVQAQNLRHLKEAGVRIVIGTDTDAGTIMAEVEDLRATQVFSNVELVRMLAEDTPRAIFPQRKIGRLEEGYEANFLVLDGDPRRDLTSLKAIRMRIKSGEVE